MLSPDEVKLLVLNEAFNEYIQRSSNEITELETRNKELRRELGDTEKRFQEELVKIDCNKHRINFLWLSRPLKEENGEEIIEEDLNRMEGRAKLLSQTDELITKHHAVVVKTNDIIKRYNKLLDLITNSKHKQR